MGCPVFHLDVPGAVFDVAVVSVAEEDAVVGVGFTALGVGGDVVDFAPLGGGVAAGDDAAAVAGEDDAFLVVGEDSLGVAEFGDFALGVGGVELDGSGAGGVFDGEAGNGEGALVGVDEAGAPVL